MQKVTVKMIDGAVYRGKLVEQKENLFVLKSVESKNEGKLNFTQLVNDEVSVSFHKDNLIYFYFD